MLFSNLEILFASYWSASGVVQSALGGAIIISILFGL